MLIVMNFQGVVTSALVAEVFYHTNLPVPFTGHFSLNNLSPVSTHSSITQKHLFSFEQTFDFNI
jgi:hypothetical protein